MAKKTAAAKKTATVKKTASNSRAGKAKKASGKRTRWLDAKSDAPLLKKYAQQMQSFVKAMADGVIEAKEVKEQEQTLVKLMKEVEPKLDDELHEKVTRLLCEVTVYDMMQMMLAMHEARPAARFRG